MPIGVIYTGRYKNILEVYYTVNFVTMILKTLAKEDKNGQFWIFAQLCTHASTCAQHDGGRNRSFCGHYGFIVFTGRFSAHLVDGIVWCQLFDCVCTARLTVGTATQCHQRACLVSRHRHSDCAFYWSDSSEHGIGGGAGHCVDVMDTHTTSARRCQSHYCDGDGQLVVGFAFSCVVWSSGLGWGGLCNAQIEPPNLSQILVVKILPKLISTLHKGA